MAVMAAERAELAVLFEHPEWQKPLFAALERRNVLAALYFNQASPSAYMRGYPTRSRTCARSRSAACGY